MHEKRDILTNCCSFWHMHAGNSTHSYSPPDRSTAKYQGKQFEGNKDSGDVVTFLLFFLFLFLFILNLLNWQDSRIFQWYLNVYYFWYDFGSLISALICGNSKMFGSLPPLAPMMIFANWRIFLPHTGLQFFLHTRRSPQYFWAVHSCTMSSGFSFRLHSFTRVWWLW